MALFDNVTYTHYSSDLGRAIVQDAATFEQFKLENVLFMKSLLNDGLIKEREAGGIDDACCMMIEEYNAVPACKHKGHNRRQGIRGQRKAGAEQRPLRGKNSQSAQ